MILEFLATTSAGLFAGAALYINLVEHPAAMKMGVPYAASGFPERYHRGAAMQAPTALVGLGAGAGAWISGSGISWLLGAVLLGAVVPFTLFVIGPTTNKHLLGHALDPASPYTKTLLVRWWWLHAARTVLGSAAFVVFVVSLVA